MATSAGCQGGLRPECTEATAQALSTIESGTTMSMPSLKRTFSELSDLSDIEERNENIAPPLYFNAQASVDQSPDEDDEEAVYDEEGEGEEDGNDTEGEVEADEEGDQNGDLDDESLCEPDDSTSLLVDLLSDRITTSSKPTNPTNPLPFNPKLITYLTVPPNIPSATSYLDLLPTLLLLDEEKLSWPATLRLLGALRSVAAESASSLSLYPSAIAERNSLLDYIVSVSARDTARSNSALAKSKAEITAMKEKMEGDVQQAIKAKKAEQEQREAALGRRAESVLAQERDLKRQRTKIAEDRNGAADIRNKADHQSKLVTARDKKSKDREAVVLRREDKAAAKEDGLRTREVNVVGREQRATEREKEHKELEFKLRADVEGQKEALKEVEKTLRADLEEERGKEQERVSGKAAASAEFVGKIADAVAKHAEAMARG